LPFVINGKFSREIFVKKEKLMKDNKIKSQDTTAQTQSCACKCKFCCAVKSFFANKANRLKAYVLVAVAAVVALCLCFGCCTFCPQKNARVAIVDINAVVSNSKQVMALKDEQVAKSQELAAWLQEAEKAVEAEKDAAKKEALLKQYSTEFAAKRDENNQYYNRQLQVLDANITQIIINEARKQGYNLVLAKSNVVYGGKDITADVIKLVK